MKDNGWEMETLVSHTIDETEVPFYNGLLQNAESISLSAAQDYNSLILLRWRRRECVSCSQVFDITSEGLLYKCGGCVA
jgi:hypothetical protein